MLDRKALMNLFSLSVLNVLMHSTALYHGGVCTCSPTSISLYCEQFHCKIEDTLSFLVIRIYLIKIYMDPIILSMAEILTVF